MPNHDKLAFAVVWAISLAVAFTAGNTWGQKTQRENQLMTITPEDAKRLLLSAQPFPGGTKNEIYVSVPGTRQSLLGREPNIIQDLSFYMRLDVVDNGMVAVYVMDKEALERIAYRESMRLR